jgi:hypothetical protein
VQIALGKLGPRQVPVVDRPSEAEESVESVRVLKIRVFLIIEKGPKWSEVLRLIQCTHGANPAEMRAKAILVLLSI